MSVDDLEHGSGPGRDHGPAPEHEHDAHLQAALRHAPDAAVTAPTSLREAILLQARIQARVGSAPSAAAVAPARITWWQRVDRATRWLSRPAVATGFASVTAATVIGLMWWDRPIDKLVAESMAPVSESARTPAAAPVQGDARTDAALAQARSKAPVVPEPKRDALKDVPTPPAVAAPATITARTDETPPAAAAFPRLSTTPSPAYQTAPGESPVLLRKDDAGVLRRRESSTESASRSREVSPDDATNGSARLGEGTKATDAKSGIADDKTRPAVGHENAARAGNVYIAAAPAAPAAKPMRAAPPIVIAAAPAPPTADAMSAAPPVATASPSGKVSAGAEARKVESDARRSAPMAAMPINAGTSPTSLSVLSAQLADEPSRWTWTRDDGAAQPVDDRVVRWVGDFDRASANADRPGAALAVGDSPPAAADALGERQAARFQSSRQGSAAPIRVDLFRDGRLQATLRIDGAGVLTVAKPLSQIPSSRGVPASDALAGLRARAPTPP